ncbi:Chloramphenicol acetyltransferase [Labilithrix luteola]|uniref:Chloramphenicol acetyltransferase n=1 Tax=Labilithrix luteola TaxID=1391654 RepID=A0A0K1PX49_9BACT|nr:acyltransferase [Labilithrix luteola]AKU98110.1 Chloramphenicol acetyltransferase [Labilithrix luteola]
MVSTVGKLVSAVRKHRALSPTALARKLRDNALALVRARIRLHTCTSLGRHARTFGNAPDVRNRGEIRIGNDFSLSCTFGTVQLATSESGRIEIGSGVSINYGTAISARESVRIGDRTKIGPYCVIADTELPLPLPLTEPSAGGYEDKASAIEIGHDVWLGGRVTLLPGARIGDGAVISAGSVVSGHIPANAVASGIPARVLRITAPIHASNAPVSGSRPRVGNTALRGTESETGGEPRATSATNASDEEPVHEPTTASAE